MEKVILSTGNINKDYEIIGLANIEVKINDQKLEGGWENFKISEIYLKINNHFIEAANRAGGNGIINIKYINITLPNFDFVVVGNGTIVKIIE